MGQAGRFQISPCFEEPRDNKIQITCFGLQCRRGTRASVSRREVLARSRGLSENRYDSFSFGAPLPLPARVALKKWGGSTTAEQEEDREDDGTGNVSIFLSLYKVQCFTKDEIHI